MANINDMLFIIQFLILIGIFLYQMFNLMHKDQLYDIRLSFILIISITIAWGLGLFVVLLETSKATYAVVFQLESMFFILSWLFFFFDIIFSLKSATETEIIKPFKSLEAKKTLNKR